MIYWMVVILALALAAILLSFVNHISIQRNIEEYSFIPAEQMKVIFQRNMACLILLMFLLIIGIVFLGVVLGGLVW